MHDAHDGTQAHDSARMTSTGRPLSRRAFVGAACGAGCLAVAGCGSGGSAASAREDSGPVQVPVADVPIGGGVILSSDRIVVTQPEAGVFRAFSAVCPHQGCLVSSVGNGAIVCGCHGSRFAIEDGSVLRNPAQQPLKARNVELAGDTLTIGM